MRIVFGWPAPEFSVWDVARGLRHALVAAGHDVRDFAYNKRINYHARAFGPAPTDPVEKAARLAAITKQASETVVVEALYHKADAVVIVSGLNFNPAGGWLLREVGIPVAVVLTESPYEDDHQAVFAQEMGAAGVFTHERISAERYGWSYLPHAYDPAIHYPRAIEPCIEPCDVLLIGSGWPERVALLEAVDWTGIDLRLLGHWPTISETSPLKPYARDSLVQNEDAPRLYAAAKICLNLHRGHAEAESLNPRAYELAACGAFTLTDRRAEGAEIFGGAQPEFEAAADLEVLIRHYLVNDGARAERASLARERVRAHTFQDRAARMSAVLEQVVSGRTVREAVGV